MRLLILALVIRFFRAPDAGPRFLQLCSVEETGPLECLLLRAPGMK